MLDLTSPIWRNTSACWSSRVRRATKSQDSHAQGRLAVLLLVATARDQLSGPISALQGTAAPFDPGHADQ